MTLNDLERQNRGFYGFFWRFWAATQGGTTMELSSFGLLIQIENLVFIY